MEHESHPHHHPHGTGVRWLDISLAIAAAIVSLVSLWLGLHSAHSMEKLVAANSYPYLELMRSISSAAPASETGLFRKRVEFEMANNGIGPARIEWVELTYKDKPVANLHALLSACCGPAQEFNIPMNARGNVSSALVRPGGSLVMFTANQTAVSNPIFDALHRSTGDIKFSACYCSVFDECYIRKEDGRKPQPVEQCTPPAVPFQPNFDRS
ncbi:hypothetical protein [Telluria aromaticivorans]|uniref:Uncharacterized protein n=1 Tax=Telluria aromaticivorans TaxID=2725995 RepID=A0A7Y2P1V8_9BURK|nr:hypothetical protein [Telluria aromaticivorans]NNG25633.1 hypothetical protein [Telluria aromaticivorans]